MDLDIDYGFLKNVYFNNVSLYFLLVSIFYIGEFIQVFDGPHCLLMIRLRQLKGA